MTRWTCLAGSLPADGSSERPVTVHPRRPRPWAVWVLMGVVLTSLAFQPDSWRAHAEETTGTTELVPGMPATLRFRSSMSNDRGVTSWEIEFHTTKVYAEAGPDSGSVLTVAPTGQVVGSGSSTCTAKWAETETGQSGWDWCVVDAACSGDAIPCETTVEFELVSISDEPVTVSWVVDAVGGGFADR